MMLQTIILQQQIVTVRRAERTTRHFGQHLLLAACHVLLLLTSLPSMPGIATCTTQQQQQQQHTNSIVKMSAHSCIVQEKSSGALHPFIAGPARKLQCVLLNKAFAGSIEDAQLHIMCPDSRGIPARHNTGMR
jgi:hypothetical protein